MNDGTDQSTCPKLKSPPPPSSRSWDDNVLSILLSDISEGDDRGKGDREKGGGRKEKGVGERIERVGERRKRVGERRSKEKMRKQNNFFLNDLK